MTATPHLPTIDSLRAHVETRLQEALRQVELDPALPTFAPPPNPEMGDYGLPCFAWAKAARKAPAAIAQQVAAALGPDEVIGEVQAAGPYVNLRLRPERVAQVVLGQALAQGEQFGWQPAGADAPTVMVEYSSPNTNKPQHLGHIRNNLLGFSVSTLLAAAGAKVIRANLVNDRGIHICKSMLAYLRWGHGATPESAGQKGDHLVGHYYVLFEKHFSAEYRAWLDSPEAPVRLEQWLQSPAGRGAAQAAEKDANAPAPAEVFRSEYKQEFFNRESELGAAAREMLRQWEAGDEATVALWRTMNGWVMDGFKATYERLGVAFDRYYFESDTYLLGKQIVEDGLASGVFERTADGAVFFDLTRMGLTGRKVLLRSDGTSVYMTQDLGTAAARFDEYALQRLVYTVADEQEYHFKVLFGVLGALRPQLSDACVHLSYGMVHLPEGKMKSREGTVVDADDLMQEMHNLALGEIEQRAQVSGEALSAEQAALRAERIGLAALKYYLLAFTPKATITFDPKKSIDFLGQTGPYCLYAYARVQSLLRKYGERLPEGPEATDAIALLQSPLEQAVVRELSTWPTTVAFAARTADPSKVAEHVWKIAKSFASLYNDREHAILACPEPALKIARLLLAKAVGNAVHSGLTLLGIETLEQM
jgi:arginyl-tRNA synthetase